MNIEKITMYQAKIYYEFDVPSVECVSQEIEMLDKACSGALKYNVIATALARTNPISENIISFKLDPVVIKGENKENVIAVHNTMNKVLNSLGAIILEEPSTKEYITDLEKPKSAPRRKM